MQATPHQQPNAPTFSGKIEGWLILFAIGLVLSPLALLWDLKDIGIISELDTSTAVGQDFSSYLIFAAFVDVALLLGVIVLAYLFVKRKAVTRTYVITFQSLNIAATIVLIAWFASLTQQYEIETTASDFSNLARAIIVASLWLLYWIFSKRVKATFVH